MHLPPLIRDLAVILAVAALVTMLFRRVKLPLALGYILAGVIVGPHAPKFLAITDSESVRTWAELGVIFLMFSMGLEFSFTKLAKVGVSAAIAGSIEISGMLVVGWLAAKIIGLTGMESIFLGCMVAISSTTIIYKTFDELGLRGRRFTERVFAILVIEDLAAILLLVTLGSIAASHSVSGANLLIALLKLAVIIGAWYLVGIFAVPRIVGTVKRHGNDEMLIVTALGLCLGMATAAAALKYSVALGAFIMGSILGGSSENTRIEHLLRPLKDLFGAIFFVSVGMLLDPLALAPHIGLVIGLAMLIIFFKFALVSFGSFLAGSSLQSALRAGLSMTQIGEFSFIIASLGEQHGVLSSNLYAVIVGASLLTTFTTPYLIQLGPKFTDYVESRLSSRIKTVLDRYTVFAERKFGSSTPEDGIKMQLRLSLTRWGASALALLVVFAVAAAVLLPLVQKHLNLGPFAGRALVWISAFVTSSPFIWGMLMAFDSKSTPADQSWAWRGLAVILGRLGTIILLGLVSLDYFDIWFAAALIGCGTFVLFIVLRHRIESYYAWFETSFLAGMDQGKKQDLNSIPHHLLPWDAQLTTIDIGTDSQLLGQRLTEIRLRERFGVNIVVVERNGRPIVAPPGDLTILPYDRLLCFGREDDITKVVDLFLTPATEDTKNIGSGDLEAYALRHLQIGNGSPLDGVRLRDSGVRLRFQCIVVGIERSLDRIANPRPDFELAEGDSLWVVGRIKDIEELASAVSGNIDERTEANQEVLA